MFWKKAAQKTFATGGRAMIFGDFAPAKVNLFLHLTGRRPDGYHLLDSLAVFPAVGDAISYRASGPLSLRLRGRFAAVLQAEPDNLMLRAARRLAAASGRRASGQLSLDKNLPVASGIGGGSADAAATLRLLARAWGIATPLDELAGSLGADVPVCLARRASCMRGVGEILSPAPALPVFGMLLVNPGVAVSTAEVFVRRGAAFSAPAQLPAGWADAGSMARDLSLLSNDLQQPAIALAPAIGEVLQTLRRLPEVLLVRMSGSGATCFALFATPQLAAQAAAELDHPGWWCWGGGLYEPGVADL